MTQGLILQSVFPFFQTATQEMLRGAYSNFKLQPIYSLSLLTLPGQWGFTIRLPNPMSWPATDNVDQDQTAPNVQSDLDLHCPIRTLPPPPPSKEKRNYFK